MYRETIPKMVVYIGRLNVLILTCLLGWSLAAVNVPTMFSVDEDCLQGYKNGKNIENYKVYASQRSDREKYTFLSSYSEMERKSEFQIELLGNESDDERRVSVSWETGYSHFYFITTSTIYHAHNDSMDEIFVFEFFIVQQMYSNDTGRDRKQLQTNRIQFDCLKISRGLRTLTEFCCSPLEGPKINNQQESKCTKKEINTIRCSCEGVAVHINETQLFDFFYVPIEMSYSIPNNLKLSADILYNSRNISVHDSGKLELDHNTSLNSSHSVGAEVCECLSLSDYLCVCTCIEEMQLGKHQRLTLIGSLMIPYFYPRYGENTVHITMFCKDFSTLGADQECYSESFNFTLYIPNTSLESDNSLDTTNNTNNTSTLESDTFVDTHYYQLTVSVIVVGSCVVLLTICVAVSAVCAYFMKKRHIHKACVEENENSNPLLEFQDSRELCRKYDIRDNKQLFQLVNKRDTANRFYPAPVNGKSKDYTYITSETSYHTTKDTVTSETDGLDSKSKRTGSRNTHGHYSSKYLRDYMSNISTSSNLLVEKPDQMRAICKESTFYQSLEKICVVTPVFTGESAESDTNTQEINGQNEHENEQDIDWGRVFTFLIPKLCTLEWRFFAIQLLSKVLPHEDNIEATISRLEQQSKSACSGDNWNHKLYTILSHWKTLSGAPTMDDIRDALRDSGHQGILNDLRNWPIPLKAKPKEIQGTIKKVTIRPELENRIEPRSTNMQVFPCFEMKRQLDQPGASHISSETDLNYQYAQSDVTVRQKRKFACFNEGNCIGNPVIDFTVQLTECEKTCTNLVCEVLHSDNERILTDDEFGVYVKYVISSIQKATIREICLKDIMKLKFEYYEDCEQIQSTRNGTMHIISSRRCRIILMDNDWKLLKLYVERARSQIIERFPDSDKAYLFLTHDGKQVSSGYLGVDETDSTVDPRRSIETYKRRRTSESMMVVHRKKMKTTSSRMRESSSEESDHESTETNSESSVTGESHNGWLVPRSKKWSRRRRSSSSRLSKKRGKARKMQSQRDRETPNYFGEIDYEKLAEAILKKQSEISKSSSSEGSVDNKSNSKVSPEPKPSTSRD